MHKKCLTWLSVFFALVIAVPTLAVRPAVAVVSDDAPLTPPAHEYGRVCGDFRPASGEFVAQKLGNTYRLYWGFTLGKTAKDALDCIANRFGQPYVEFEVVLTGFGGKKDWNGYTVVNTSLPGAIRDEGWMDSAANAAPGVTNVKVSSLNAHSFYHFELVWHTSSEFYPLSGQSQRASFQMAPSHWASNLNQTEMSACYLGDYSPEWCIFPGGVAFISGAYYTFFRPPARDGLPFTNTRKPYAFPPPAPISGYVGGNGVVIPQPGVGGSAPQPSRQMFLRGDSMLFAKDNLANGDWVQESEKGSIKAIAAAGAYQMVLNACNAVYIRNTLGKDGWIQQTPCFGAERIAVSSTGLQMVIDANGAVWAKYGMGDGGWTRETADHTAYAIAAGGHTQVIITACRAIFARNNIGYEGWHFEMGCGNANAIAATSTGIQMFIRGDAAVFARRGIGQDWVMQVGPGNAQAIAAGGNTLMFLRGDCAVFAKNHLNPDGWTMETEPRTANAIAVGDQGRQMVRTGGMAIWAKDHIGYGGWLTQVGDGNAAAIAVG